MRVVIAWLYPRQMGTYGDQGNILALRYRCAQRGIEAVVRELHPGERLHAEDADLFFLGGGMDRNQVKVAQALQEEREAIARAVRSGSVFLGVCGGYQLLGRHYALPSEDRIPGLALLDLYTESGHQRMVGPVSAAPHTELGLSELLVGYENHGGKTFLGSARPLAKILRGGGNGGSEGTEGAFAGDVFGTYLHGPFLPLNPEFCDLLIRRALRRRYGAVELRPLDASLEGKARLARSA